MKRLLTAVMLVALALGFSVAAQADPMTEHNGGIAGTFTGKEVLLDDSGALLTDDTALYRVGTNLYGVFTILSAQELIPASSTGNLDGYVYSSGAAGTGAYFAVLSGLKIAGFAENDSRILFTGGVVTMYYTADYDGLPLGTAISRMAYIDGDFVYQDYSLNALMAAATVVFEANFAESSAGLTMENGVLNATYWTYAHAAEGYEEWVNGAFGNGGKFDFELSVTVRPNSPGYLVGAEGSFKGNHAAPTPEPGTFILMSLGLLLTAGFARRQQM